MLTIFTNPRAFNNQFGTIQRNAIKSWLLLRPKCEIILFGEDEGVAETAKEFGVRHIPEIEKNEFGTPLLDSVFNLAQKLANNHFMVYISADIILLSDFIRAVKTIKESSLSSFLMVGQRIDLDIEEELQFNDINWEAKLRKLAINKGKLHSPEGADYFVFPKGFYHNVPPFAIGRTVHDNWLIYKARALGAPVIDATRAITAIHQNHDYSHHSQGVRGVRSGPEKRRNLKLAGGRNHRLTIVDADWLLTENGLKKKAFLTIIFRKIHRSINRGKTLISDIISAING